MPNFSASTLIKELKGLSEEDKKKKAQSDVVIKKEIENVMEDTKISLFRQSRENAARYALWQGLLNQYGIFGNRRDTKRLFGENKNINYYDKNYEHGDLISIDFGTSNLDKEFSFTHTAIVLKSYTDYIVVIPTTSCKEGRLETKPQDEQDDTLLITSKDFADIESDSYIMIYQIRSVSKNRIQKKIGSIKGTKLLNKIEHKIAEVFAISFYDDFNACNKEINEIKQKNEEIKIEIEDWKTKVEDLKKVLESQEELLTQKRNCDTIGLTNK